MTDNFLTKVVENAVFVVEFLAIVLILFFIAYGIEKWDKKKKQEKERILTTRKMALIGMFSALATIFMLFDFSVPFAPAFYQIDFSEVPALIAAFSLGPVAGVLVEFLKILLKLLFKSTTTAFVGELANFVVGCSFLLPASIIYYKRKNKKQGMIGCIVGTICMTIFGTAFNAVYLLPTFATLYGMNLEDLISMGTAINPAITNVSTFVFFSVAPLNLLKGILVSVITMLIYKKISPIIKSGKH
ncbi:MAG: ECF transporter S component [Lachnospiraceae bacterium]